MLVLVLGLCATMVCISCGSTKPKDPPSGLPDRVLASQGVTSTFDFGALRILNGYNDSIPRVQPIGAGNNPGLMAVTPTRNFAAAFDSSTNTVYLVNTYTESDAGNIRLPGPITSMVFPSAVGIGYAAVPTATVQGFDFIGALDVMNFNNGTVLTIPVNNAETVVANSNGSQLLVFSNDSNSVTVLSPSAAVPPVDQSCSTAPNAVCTVIPGFDRPVNAVISGNTAYILNCGAECGGIQASVQTLDLTSLTVGAPVPVNGATIAVLSGSQLYVAGNGTPTGPLCTSIPSAAPTAATYCGTLDIVNVSTMTDPYFNNPASEIAITDGYHDRIDLTVGGQVFVGSYNCTNVGDSSDPVGEVRGCLAIYNSNTNAVVIPPDNGNVTGLQGFISRTVEYVAEDGNLRVYETDTDTLLIDDYLPQGTINVTGYVWDVKAIDFF
jgi:hypothetical protein